MKWLLNNWREKLTALALALLVWYVARESAGKISVQNSFVPKSGGVEQIEAKATPENETPSTAPAKR